MTTPPLVLASASRYRRDLLARLHLAFSADPATLDETALPAETPVATALRLSIAKAEHVAARHPGAIVIGSDQVAEYDGRAFGKPGSHERAVAQLRELRGKEVRFHSGLCVIGPDAAPGDATRRRSDVVTTTVRFRLLTDATIERYLVLEKPYDCAGSAKAEALGIALLERIDSADPTALIGLPLIALVTMLAELGLPVPGPR